MHWCLLLQASGVAMMLAGIALVVHERTRSGGRHRQTQQS